MFTAFRKNIARVIYCIQAFLEVVKAKFKESLANVGGQDVDTEGQFGHKEEDQGRDSLARESVSPASARVVLRRSARLSRSTSRSVDPGAPTVPTSSSSSRSVRRSRTPLPPDDVSVDPISSRSKFCRTVVGVLP